VDGKIVDNGKAPLLLEPVKAAVTIASRPVAEVKVLDPSGNPTARTLPVTNGQFAIDGTQDRTLYYQVIFR
jgi:hypothetical protein